jgi:hypothetical protein
MPVSWDSLKWPSSESYTNAVSGAERLTHAFETMGGYMLATSATSQSLAPSQRHDLFAPTKLFTCPPPKGFQMSASKKPEGWKAFDSLARKVVGVPKADVDAKVAKDKAKRIKQRKKKK